MSNYISWYMKYIYNDKEEFYQRVHDIINYIKLPIKYLDYIRFLMSRPDILLVEYDQKN